MELYQWHGKCGYEHMLVCTLKHVRQRFSGLASWPASSQGHAGSPWRKSKNHLIRPIWQFSATKLWNNYFLPLHFFKQITIRFNNFLVFIGLSSSLCNIKLDSPWYFNIPDNVFIDSWATEPTICRGYILSDLCSLYMQKFQCTAISVAV